MQSELKEIELQSTVKEPDQTEAEQEINKQIDSLVEWRHQQLEVAHEEAKQKKRKGEQHRRNLVIWSSCKFLLLLL